MRFSDTYPLFERLVAWALLLGMVVVVLLAAASFGLSLWEVSTQKVVDATTYDYEDLQGLFDKVLAALIALELAHSVHQMATGKHGLTQVKTIIVIGVLAVVRKLIPLEFESASGTWLLGLAAAILALGALFALINFVEERRGREAAPVAPGDED